MRGIDIILGIDWMVMYGVSNDTKQRTINVKVKEMIHTLKSDLVLNAYVPPPSLSALDNAPMAIIFVDEATDPHNQGLSCWLMLVQTDQATTQSGLQCAIIDPSDVELGSYDPQLVDPSDIQALLDEIKDVIQDRPPGLPPVRGMSHTI